jgi:uncharacterized protein
LMVLYPGLKAAELVGTDLVQAVPLVMSAALSHLLFGDFSLALTVPMLLGAVPGAFLGAQISTRAPGRPGAPRAGLRAARVVAEAARREHAGDRGSARACAADRAADVDARPAPSRLPGTVGRPLDPWAGPGAHTGRNCF